MERDELDFCDEDFVEGFDPTDIEQVCRICLRHEAILCGLCAMCSELHPDQF
jgi:hypothetical protein